MYKQAWDEIESIYNLPNVNQEAVTKFQKFKHTQPTHTKKVGNLDHYCSFFVPFDQSKMQVYLGDHIKARGWIPPGGHIEPGETPKVGAIREMQEELGVTITQEMLEPIDLSVTVVNQELRGCMTHYDVWHLVHIPVQNFVFLRAEYHDARLFPLEEAVKRLSPFPHFAAIVDKVKTHSI